MYDADGTQPPVTLTGARISSQLRPAGDGFCSALVVVSDEEDRTVEVFQAARVYSIRKRRVVAADGSEAAPTAPGT